MSSFKTIFLRVYTLLSGLNSESFVLVAVEGSFVSSIIAQSFRRVRIPCCSKNVGIRFIKSVFKDVILL